MRLLLCLSFLILGMLDLSAAHIGGETALQDVNSIPRVYCGRILAQMVYSLCLDQKEMEKRSGPRNLYSAMVPYYKEKQESHIGWPWMTAAKAKSMTAYRGKRFIGIADECCDKPCTINELRSYC